MATWRGWYQDPDDAQQVRYWDGSGWTEDRLPMVVLLHRLVEGQEKAIRATRSLWWGLLGIWILIALFGFQIVDLLNRRL